jgi:hypothetical protein
MSANITGLIALPWPELILTLEEALENWDFLTLDGINIVFRDRFFALIYRKASPDEFITSMMLGQTFDFKHEPMSAYKIV